MLGSFGGAVKLSCGSSVVETSRPRISSLRKIIHDDTEAIFTGELAPYEGVAAENTRYETVKHDESRLSGYIPYRIVERTSFRRT